MKEKLTNALGSFGSFIWLIISMTIAVIPIVAIGMPFWINIILFAIMLFIPATSVIFWVWGLIRMINGPQDVVAIVYYVLFVVLFLPTFIQIMVSLIQKISGKK